MLSKNARATNVDSILPADTLLNMVEEEYCLDRTELWEFLKVCPGLSGEDKKTLLLLFFLTKNNKESGGEVSAKVLEIWNELDKKLNLVPRKKSLCQLVKELPKLLWRKPCRILMRRNNTDENGCVTNVKGRSGRQKINIYRLERSFTYIKVTSKVSKNSGGIFTLVVDTGASASVIKSEVLDSRLVIMSKEEIEPYGIVGNELVETLGTSTIPMYYDTKKFRVGFNIVRKAKNLPFDGVIGRNFFEDNEVIIDYKKQEIFLKHRGWAVPFFSQIASFSQKCIVPGHSERKVRIMVKHSKKSKGYLPQCELAPGIFLSRGVVKKSKIAAVNATIKNIYHFDQTVEPFCIELFPLPKFVDKDWAILQKEMRQPPFMELEAKYEYFVNNLESMQGYPELLVHDFNPDLHTPNALFCPMNIDKIRVFSKIVNTVYKPHLAKPPGLYKVTKYFTPTMITYLCTDRYLYIEQPSTKDTFFTLYNLKEKLLKEKYSGQFCILELNRLRRETPRALFFRMIQHVFENTDIEPVLVMRKIQTPKTEEEKMKAMNENHIDKKDKHLGFVRTYNFIRDGYNWSTMRGDVMDYMLKCEGCKYDLTRFKAMHRVLQLKALRKKE